MEGYCQYFSPEGDQDAFRLRVRSQETPRKERGGTYSRVLGEVVGGGQSPGESINLRLLAGGCCFVVSRGREIRGCHFQMPGEQVEEVCGAGCGGLNCPSLGWKASCC